MKTNEVFIEFRTTKREAKEVHDHMRAVRDGN